MRLSPHSRHEPLALIHVADFESLAHSTRWTVQANRTIHQTPGLRFAKLLTSLGTRASAGFAAVGVPDLRRVVTFLVWESAVALEAFLAESPLARAWRDCRWAWQVRAAPLQSRGTFHGISPFSEVPRSAASTSAAWEGPMAALTLGRASWRQMLAFARVSPPAGPFLTTDGLVTAVSAGLPAKGNLTFTLWDSEEAMLRFAYREPPGAHRETVRQSKARSLLVEQLSARLVPLRIEGCWDPATTPNAAALGRLATRLGAQAAHNCSSGYAASPGADVDSRSR